MHGLKIGAAAIGLAALLAGAADAAPKVAVGLLECNVERSLGLLLGSQRRMACTFRPAGSAPHETYYGRITRLGVDLGVTSRQVMVWAVYAPARNRRPGALAGSYGGVSGEATIGAGVGANVLVGGLRRSVTLQPVSVQTQLGANLAVGVAGLELYAAGE